MAQLSQLLLFDPDPSGLDTLAYGLEKEGCVVTGTTDPVKARDLIQGSNPALVVVNLRDGGQSGMDLVRATASNPRTRNLACVAIGREELRAGALAAGAFVFLSVPLFVRDVLTACRLVAAAAVPGSRPSPEAEVSLRLVDLDGVYFLVRALAVTGRSAVVEVRRDASRGELRFIDGSLSSAQLGPLEGLPALHQMLLWDDAALHFKFKNVARRGTPLSMKSSELTEECDRFLRDFAHEARDLGFARTVYDADSERVQPSNAFPSEVLPLLRLIDGRRDLAHVLEESPFRVFDTLKILKRFVADEAIRPKMPLPPAGRDAGAALSGPGALNFWLQRQAPILGAEVGRRGENVTSRLPAVSSDADAGARGIRTGGRPSSPFVAVTGSDAPKPDGKAHGKHDRNVDRKVHGKAGAKPSGAADATGIPNRRQRTITQREHVIEPVRNAVAPEDIVTPPPIVQPGAPKPAAAVAQGEIRIASATSPAMNAVPSQSAPTVLVDIGPTPPPVVINAPAPTGPETSGAPAGLAAQGLAASQPAQRVAEGATASASTGGDGHGEETKASEPAPTPNPVAATASTPNAQPAQVLHLAKAGELAPARAHTLPSPLAPAAEHAPAIGSEHAPGPAQAAAPTESAPPSVIIAPMTPPPVLTERARPHNPTPATGAETTKRSPRSPSDNFNALESDFFEREADLYKRESVESFDDLDGASRPGGRANGRVRKP